VVGPWGWGVWVKALRSYHGRWGEVICLGNDLVLVIVINLIGRSIGEGDGEFGVVD
jgi:hypothetical protein